MSDEAAWKVEKAKYEEPGYAVVRKSRGLGEFRGGLEAGLDGVAGEWIKLNKSDLDSGGAGGSYDDTALWKEIADLNDKVDNLDIPDTTNLATKDELAALQNQVTKDIADLKDHLDNHPSGGGDTTQIEEDITKLQESVTNLEVALQAVEDGLAQEITDREEGDQNLQDQIDNINTKGYDDTELRGLISDEEDARVEGDKDLQDQIDAIQTSGYDDTKIREDFAAADELLQDQIDALEGFDPTPLEEKDAEQDGRLDQIDLDQKTQNDRLDQIDKDQKTQDDRLDALEAGEMGAVVGNWKRNDRADVSGGMIGVSNFNNVSSIMLSRNDMTHQPFDFSEVEVGTTLTISFG